MGGGTMYVDVPSSNLNLPVSTNQSVPLDSSFAVSCSEYHGKRDGLALGDVPSKLEVENAVSALEKYMLEGSSSEPELKWLCHIGNRMNNVLSMMQSQPSLKRLVISLSSDKAVWDAINNNVMVSKLCETTSPSLSIFHGLFTSEKGRQLQYSQVDRADEDLFTRILNWIIDIAKAKVTELLFKFQALVSKVLQHHGCKKLTCKSAEQLEDELRSSLVLSMVILLIVLVARVR